jgi:ParB family transcriptional regulator, chromosome partitioning protein
MKNKGLGKGLSALINDSTLGSNSSSQDSGSVYVPIEKIIPNRFQPRKYFDQNLLQELSDSIKIHGIIQPVVLRKIDDNSYEIIAGERRTRAAKLAGLFEVPAVLREVSDLDLSSEAIIENIQRENLNPVEESEAYKDLISKFNYSQEELSKSIGKNRSHIANMLRINDLPNEVKEYIKQGKLSFSHAKVIASSSDVKMIADEIVKKSLNVRQSESLVKNFSNKFVKVISESKKPESGTPKTSDDIKAISDSLSNILGFNVVIEPNGAKGKVCLNYRNFEELDNIVEFLSSGKI